ncbi:MAG: site-specific DNA-methyltransferase [Fervidobacterium sp.]
MSNTMSKYEVEFYNALEDIFIGEEIEGRSGYVNLMKIKSAYYRNVVKSQLQELIDSELTAKDIEDFREELFEKLYTFFKRYFSETGSIYYTYTPWSERVYERVYDPEKDVILFWKTHMLYYVKTEKNYKSVEIKIDTMNGGKISFFFDVSEFERQKANEKRDVVFEFKEIDSSGRVTLTVKSSERGNKTKIDDITKEITKTYKEITTDDIEKAMRIFNKQSEVDFFINKNAREFLSEQLDIYTYQYMFDSKNVWNQKRVKEIQVFKEIADKIIDLISQFEDELVKIWNKPKIVFNSNYVITIDRIVNNQGGYDVLKKILEHPGINEQTNEWRDLGIVDENFKATDIINNALFDDPTNINAKYKFLPIDTKYFKNIELDIIGLFQNLDNELDGWLIKSENYQALNTILPKFKEQIQTIYIDPPFNKENEADYLYKVGYKDATWASMLENRLRLARNLLSERGSIFVRCDYNGNWIVRPIMNEIFGEENFRNEIVVGRTKTALYIGTAPEKAGVSFKSLMMVYDNIYLYSKSEKFFNKFSEGIIKEEKKSYWKDFKTFFDRDYNRYELLGITPEKGCSWMWRKEEAEKAVKNYQEYLREYNLTNVSLENYWERTGQRLNFIKKEGNTLKYWVAPSKKVSHNNWTALEGYGRGWSFPTENSEPLLKRVIESTSNRGDLVMDFFLGSGATTAVAHKLGRKWIGVEMGEHFWTVVLPRMKKVLAYDKSGISKEQDVKETYNEKTAGGFFKYYELEQYEDVLRNAKYEHGDLSLQPSPNEDVFNEYLFMRSPKFVETAVQRVNNEFKVDLGKIYAEKSIDIAETISNVLGEKIVKITRDAVELQNVGKVYFESLPIEYVKPLIWW